MDNYEMFSKPKEADEIEKLVESYVKLQFQINYPTRDGMIEALSSAQRIELNERTTLEKIQGNIVYTPWSNFSDYDLYCMLKEHLDRLHNHAVNKLGEEAFKKLLEEYTRATQNQ